MIGFISKLFGGSKSEKDIKIIQPRVGIINQHFVAYQSISNDELRAKTQEFKQRIQDHLQDIDAKVKELAAQGEELPFSDITGKDAIYQEIDSLKKDRDKKVEEVLGEILPEAFAVVKETARRFKENPEMIATATDLGRSIQSRV